MIGIGVIGYGYWGPNLVRNFAECRVRPCAWCATNGRSGCSRWSGAIPA